MPLILLADDDFANLAILQEVILSAGYEVVTASDGAEAFAICQSEPVDFVLTDYQTPKLSGLELGEKIKGEIPFAVMSSADIEHLALSAGAVAFFKKPVKPQEILGCIMTHTR